MPFDQVVETIAARAGQLPGPDAQVRMAPIPRQGWRPGIGPSEARSAAGLLLVFPDQGEAILLLTKRSSTLPQHRGQVSLPGGAVDPGETLEAAALREAHEEVGLDPSTVTIVGRLTPIHIPVSGFLLHPIIGTTAGRPGVRIASGEVDRITDVPVAELADPARRHRTTRVRDGIEFDMPFFDVGGEQVWGATAMVLAEFVAMLGAWETE